MSSLSTVVAPVVGVILANCMFVSPLKEVLAAREKGNLGCINPLPFLLIFSNCPFGMSYGLLRNDWYIFLANIAGAPLGLFFVITAIELTSGELRRKLEWGALSVYSGSIIVALVIGLGMHGQHEKQVNVFGTICTINAALFFASPLSVLAQVVRTRDASSLSVPLCATSLTCAAVWVVYGVAQRDFAVFLSNMPGVLAGVAQVVLIALFGRGGTGAGNASGASGGGSAGAVGRAGKNGDGGAGDGGDDTEEAGLLPLRAFDDAPAGAVVSSL